MRNVGIRVAFGLLLGLMAVSGFVFSQLLYDPQAAALDQVLNEYRLVKLPDTTQAIQAFKDYQLTSGSSLFGKSPQLSQVSQLDGGYIYIYSVDGKQAALSLVIIGGQPSWIPVPLPEPTPTPAP